MATDARTAPADAPSRRAAGLLWRTSAPERRNLVIALIGLAVAGALDAAGPALGKAFIDRYLVPRDPAIGAMLGLLLGALAAGVVATWLRFFQLTRLAGVAMRSVQRLREQVYGHALALPVAFFDRAITGQIVSRITNDTEAVKLLYVQVLFIMLDAVVMLATLIVTMAFLDWRLMLIVVALGPAVVGIVTLYRKLSAPAVARTRELRGELNVQTAEAIGGMSVLQATGAIERYRERYARLNASHLQSRRRELRANAWLLRPALDLLTVAMLALVIAAFGLRDQGGALGTVEVGIVYAFVSYLARVTEPLIQLTMQFSQLQQAVVASARVNTLLEEPVVAPPTEGARPRDGSVVFEHVTFGYDPAHPVLHDISFEIPPGEFIGVVGPTGSGKSTLLALMLRFYQTPRGRVMLGAHPIAAIGETAFREAVGLVPQDPFLLAASVRENIAMGRPLAPDRIESAARAAGAHDFIVRLEHGYDTVLGEGGARLSSGEKQLVAIARALAGEPRILLLDEATARIDTQTERQVRQTLAALAGRLTVISVAHRLATIRDADRILVMSHGRLVESGPHEVLMAREDGLYRRLVEKQQLESVVEE